jgi:hypothetical protein
VYLPQHAGERTLIVITAVNDKGLRIGQGHHHAKLTDHEVLLLLELHAAGWSYGQLAEKFEVSKSLARKIVKGDVRAQTAAGFRTVKG